MLVGFGAWVLVGFGFGAWVLVGAGARVLVGTGVRVLVGAGVRVLVGCLGFDDAPPLVGVGVLVATAGAVGCVAVATDIGVLVAVSPPAVGVKRGVFVGWRVAVARGVLVVVAVAALVAVAGGVWVGGVVGASGSRSPIAPTRSTSGCITDAAVAVGSGVLRAPMVGRGAAVSSAASIG